MPNVHSTSFLIDSNLFDHHDLSIKFEIKNRYSTRPRQIPIVKKITYTPVYVVDTIFPSPLYVRRLNSLLKKKLAITYTSQELIHMHNHLVVPIIRTITGCMKVVTSMVACQVECASSATALSPKMIVFQFILASRSIVICVQSDEPTHPGNPLSPYSSMLDFVSSRCTGVSTNLARRTVIPLPNLMKTQKRCGEPLDLEIWPYSPQCHQTPTTTEVTRRS